MHPKSQTLMEVHIFMGKKGRFCICCFYSAGFQPFLYHALIRLTVAVYFFIVIILSITAPSPRLTTMLGDARYSLPMCRFSK